MSFWQDSSFPGILEELLQKEVAKGLDGSQALMYAERALERQQLFSRESAKSEMLEVLANPEHVKAGWCEWAIRMAFGFGASSEVNSQLRSRLDRAEKRMFEIYATLAQDSLPGERHASDKFREEFVSTFEVTSHDMYFDLILEAYFKNGGSCSNQELGRLRFLGVIGNPAERLQELLSGPN